MTLFLLFIVGTGCGGKESDICLIASRADEIVLDGDINEAEWEGATVISGLVSPWVVTAEDSTLFRCYCSPKYFNFCYKVIDKSITLPEISEELDVADGDRVELFLSPTEELSPYYCLEMNPEGYVLDYKAVFHRNFDFDWNFSLAEIVGKIVPNGYLVEGRIAISELESLGIDLKNGFYLGIFRADFIELSEESAIWHSWIKPDIEEPDFHIPSALRKCILKE